MEGSFRLTASYARGDWRVTGNFPPSFHRSEALPEVAGTDWTSEPLAAAVFRTREEGHCWDHPRAGGAKADSSALGAELRRRRKGRTGNLLRRRTAPSPAPAAVHRFVHRTWDDPTMLMTTTTCRADAPDPRPHRGPHPDPTEPTWRTYQDWLDRRICPVCRRYVPEGAGVLHLDLPGYAHFGQCTALVTNCVRDFTRSRRGRLRSMRAWREEIQRGGEDGRPAPRQARERRNTVKRRIFSGGGRGHPGGRVCGAALGGEFVVKIRSFDRAVRPGTLSGRAEGRG
jgi:hypothetical protein